MTEKPKPLGARLDTRNVRDEEFSPSERAEIRKRNEILDEEFMSPDQVAKELGLAWLVRAVRALPSFGIMAAIYAIVAGGGAWLLGLFEVLK